MSRKLATLVYEKRVGSAHRKAILAYCADRASDNGCGIWCSKATIAAETEISRSTIIKVMSQFVEEGILVVVGSKKCANGSTVIYDMNVDAVRALDDVEMPGDPSVSRTSVDLDPSASRTPPVRQPDPTRPSAGPQDVRQPDPNRPRTVLEPSLNHTSYDEFGEFWALCPRKVGKGEARRRYEKARKVTDRDTLLRGMEAHAESREGRDPKFTPHPATWLSQERWLDECLLPNLEPFYPQTGGNRDRPTSGDIVTGARRIADAFRDD